MSIFIRAWPVVPTAVLSMAALAASPAAGQKQDAPKSATSGDFVGRGVPMPPRGQGTEPYELSVVDGPPLLLNRDATVDLLERSYPAELRDSGVTGTVMLRFVVRNNGTVDPLSIAVESASHADFVEPATTVVRGMLFRPSTVLGRPVRVWVTLPIIFQLEEPEATDGKTPPTK